MIWRPSAKLILRMVWPLTCIIATLYTTIDQFRNYFNIEDQTIVAYRRFNEIETDIYPSLTLCWTMTIIEEKLRRYRSTVNATDYARFLAGVVWDENMLSVDYDNVTPALEDYVFLYGYQSTSEQFVFLYDRKEVKKLNRDLKQRAMWGMKCLTFDIPFQKGLAIKQFFLSFNSSIFGKGGRLANPDHTSFEQNQFHVTIHYRNQALRNNMVGQRYWPFREPGSPTHYLMRLSVGTIDVLVRRNTKKNPCVEGVPDYDEKVVNHIMETVKCKPPYWNAIPSLNPCFEQKQLQNITYLFAEAVSTSHTMNFYTVETPCRSLERISIDVMDVQTPQRWLEMYPFMNESVGIMLDFKELIYKEVKNVRGMDTQALIGKYRTIILSSSNSALHTYTNLCPLFSGNAGGYLGLFLGYAVLNIPELLQVAFDWLHKKWNKRKIDSAKEAYKILEKIAPGSAGPGST